MPSKAEWCVGSKSISKAASTTEYISLSRTVKIIDHCEFILFELLNPNACWKYQSLLVERWTSTWRPRSGWKKQMCLKNSSHLHNVTNFMSWAMTRSMSPYLLALLKQFCIETMPFTSSSLKICHITIYFYLTLFAFSCWLIGDLESIIQCCDHFWNIVLYIVAQNIFRKISMFSHS